MNPSINPSASLLKHFESIDEPRTEYLIEHQLLDIIAITICAVICGAALKDYATHKLRVKAGLRLKNTDTANNNGWKNF